MWDALSSRAPQGDASEEPRVKGRAAVRLFAARDAERLFAAPWEGGSSGSGGGSSEEARRAVEGAARLLPETPNLWGYNPV